MIVDPEAAAAAACGRRGGASALAASAPRSAMPARTPVEAEWRVVRLGSGDLHRHRPDVWRRAFQYRPDGAGQRRRRAASRRCSPPSASRRPTRRCSAMSGSSRPSADPRRSNRPCISAPISQPIAEAVLCVRSPGAHLRPGRTAVPASARRPPPPPRSGARVQLALVDVSHRYVEGICWRIPMATERHVRLFRKGGAARRCAYRGNSSCLVTRRSSAGTARASSSNQHRKNRSWSF